ncbi:hypothetical protein BDW74DRAFT_175198 [Aspergillus multicolor]|uniref:uncharacterized protein n=1 Tax=Aspergillus multicolor TaxID=41759 RepID=UPI003CCCFEF1
MQSTLIFSYSHECYESLCILEELLELYHETLYKSVHGHALTEAFVDFKFRYDETCLEEGAETSLFDAVLKGSRVRDKLVEALMELHMTLEKSIGLATNEKKHIGKLRAASLLAGSLDVIAEQVDKFCYIVDGILEGLGREGTMPMPRRCEF